MPTQQNVVYYDGVPYISTAPMQQQGATWGQGGTGGFGGSNNGYLGMSGLNNSRLSPGLTFEQQMARGLLTPLQQGPKAPTKPAMPLTQMPQPGWQPQGAQSGGLDEILNGGAQQFAPAPAPSAPIGGGPAPGGGQLPQIPPMGMPNPQRPQQNFDALGQNLMAQILKQQGGV